MNPRKKSDPILVGTMRSQHGTRLCHRIVCSRCHQEDYIAKKIAGAKCHYCRDCAEKLLNMFEVGRRPSAEKIILACHQCKKKFEMLASLAEKKSEIMCRDCYRGFAVWRGKVDSSEYSDSVEIVIKKPGAKTIIRKRTK